MSDAADPGASPAAGSPTTPLERLATLLGLPGRAADLAALLDEIVPLRHRADDQGLPAALLRVLDQRPDRRTAWAALLSTVLGAGPGAPDLRPLDDDPVGRDLAELVSATAWADRADGGDERLWAELGWTRFVDDVRPPEPPVVPGTGAVLGPEALPGLADRYDAVVIGSGAGGGTAAALLAESGRTVLVVEAGAAPSRETLATGQLRNPRMEWGLPMPTRSADPADRRIRPGADGTGEAEVAPWAGGWLANAQTLGGGTRVYGAQAWRFGPEDFRMAGTYGVPDGSALADWPIGYDDLEPWYARAEWEVGVSGDDRAGPYDGHRSRPYPMPPLPEGPTATRLAAAADRVGLGVRAVPLLINSGPYLGRPGCVRCRACVGFACPVEAKNDSRNTMLVRALATGRTTVITGTRATRIVVDVHGRAAGVALSAGPAGPRRVIDAATIMVGAGAVETARLLLASAHDGEPQGIGNRHDQVGRHLQGHLYGGAFALFDEEVDDLLGPGPSVATTDLRHGNPGIVGGGMLADEFTLPPVNLYAHLVALGVVPRWGGDSIAGVRRWHRRLLRMMGPVQEVTSADSRVRLDPRRVDGHGVPLAVLSGGLHREDERGRAFLAGRAADWLTAAGAARVFPIAGPAGPGPSGGQHQAGTCRMGADPAASVVDPDGRVWGHDNLYVVDGSSHVTNGGVNPVLTIFANAMRITDRLVRAG
ncbi:choline dehydrogenase-like flavoprotein [Friedmanniella endophytica]|uniref:Choline dehydrogenase-like flavoprotein n=1 Tax=Microlunatus kandeliicorticis TaxID=1759536 RepID=A0A7W3P5F2_9ACTN|nr:GMC family oxidoreductase [Microlunatus kandeliicorticis]MBA8793919.1 choline dehydrogenase-like flavoprotein [Microlunatus kandeliicorticis]